jgi:hypothetical protein
MKMPPSLSIWLEESSMSQIWSYKTRFARLRAEDIIRK